MNVKCSTAREFLQDTPHAKPPYCGGSRYEPSGRRRERPSPPASPNCSRSMLTRCSGSRFDDVAGARRQASNECETQIDVRETTVDRIQCDLVTPNYSLSNRNRRPLGFVAAPCFGRTAAVLVHLGRRRPVAPAILRWDDTDVLDAHVDFYARDVAHCSSCAQGQGQTTGISRYHVRTSTSPTTCTTQMASTAEVFRLHGVLQFRVRGRHRPARAARVSSS